MNATANANVTATFTVAVTTSITTTCRATNIEMKISRNIRTCKLSKGHISNVIAMANCIKFKLSGLDGRDFELTNWLILLPLLYFITGSSQMKVTCQKKDHGCITTGNAGIITTTTVTSTTTIPKGMKVQL